VTEYVERLIYHPGALQVLDFADGKVAPGRVRAQRDGLLVGQSLRELARHLPGWKYEWSRSTATAAASRPRGTPSWQRVTRYSSWPHATTSVAS